METAGGAEDPDGAEDPGGAEDPEDGEPLPPRPAITIAAAGAARATIQPARPERPSVNGGLCGMGRSVTCGTGSSAGFPTTTAPQAGRSSHLARASQFKSPRFVAELYPSWSPNFFR